MMLIFDVMQRKELSIAPGAILSMAEFTKHVIYKTILTSNSQSNFEPSRSTQTGNGKSSSIAVRALQDTLLWTYVQGSLMALAARDSFASQATPSAKGVACETWGFHCTVLCSLVR